MGINSRDGLLTDAKIEAAKFEDRGKPWRLTDGNSLYLLITKTGKYFRYDYRFGGKRKTLALGVYPEVSLKEARGLRDNARQLIRQGIDPSEKKKAEKAVVRVNGNYAFNTEIEGLKMDEINALDFFAGCAIASGRFDLNNSDIPENVTAKLAYDLAEAMLEESEKRMTCYGQI